MSFKEMYKKNQSHLAGPHSFYSIGSDQCMKILAHNRQHNDEWKSFVNIKLVIFTTPC
jgi:hypothetical protein